MKKLNEWKEILPSSEGQVGGSGLGFLFQLSIGYFSDLAMY